MDPLYRAPYRQNKFPVKTLSFDPLQAKNENEDSCEEDSESSSSSEETEFESEIDEEIKLLSNDVLSDC